jgi:nucleoid-associated protein YgaU
MRQEDMGDAENITSGKPEQSHVEYMAEHVMKPDETLSHLALKYYGSAVRDMWMIIYEANKDVIGPDPAHVRPGTVLKIPKLPKA